jgi:glycerol-3-phosphate dehydrogenase
VIGAGINGAGIARDAAMRGLRVLLLDKGDIGGGTSSWSTRLIHGGLRYLEHGEFSLVHESLREREALLNISAHLVRPLRMMAPIYKKARRGVWTIRAGMIAYDVLSFAKKLPRHRMLSRAATLREAPGLLPEGLLGAAVYFDAQVEFAERLVVENALSAVEHGATVITYARVDKLLVEDGKVCGVEFSRVRSPTSTVQSQSDFGTGGVSPADRTLDASNERHSVHAKVVINAAGPWIDEFLAHAATETSPRLIGGTKGSHIIVSPFAGAPDAAIYVEAETDQRPFFIIPWNRNYLIGTTDIRYEGDLDKVVIESTEIDYLLGETNRLFPVAHLTREQVLYTYAGVRPLPFTKNKDELSITRKHYIRSHPHIDNLFSIVGGKLTTYRSLAAQTVDLVFKKLGRSSPACTTDQERLPGANPDFEAFTREFMRGHEFSQATANRLLRIYGTRASLIVELLTNDASLAEVFDSETGAIAAEVVHAFKQELAQTLSDCLLRRTMVGLNSSCGLDAMEAAADVMKQHLGWSDNRVAEEVNAYRREVVRKLCKQNRE